jgi:hypothetical protein
MPLDPLWQAIARETPDARAKRSVAEKKHKLLGWMEEIFCVNCGQSGGMITRDWAAYVTYLCDECVAKHGRAPMTEVPEQLVRSGG